MVSQTTLILAVTSLISGYASRVLYQRRVRPILDSNEEVYSKSRVGVAHPQNGVETTEMEVFTKRETYFLEILNRGRNSASNVKAHLVLEGTTELEEDFPEIHLSLRTPLRWSEANRPSSTEINPKETIGLEILSIQNQVLQTENPATFGEDLESPNRISSIEVPAEDEPIQRALSGGDRFEIPHFTIASDSDEEIPPAIQNLSWTPRQFSNIDWQTAKVEITADNVGKLEQALEIDEDSGEISIEATELTRESNSIL